MSLKNLYILSCLLLLPLWAHATHNRAGEIIFQQIGELRIRASIITYTKESSHDADRDTLILYWGDGTFQKVGRNNGSGHGISLGGDVKYNIYTYEHTYPSRGTYTISMTDPNRNGGILNVNPPNSDNVPFYLETTFTFLNSTFQGYNNTPTLLQPPIDEGCIDQPFIHNPNAFDIDGDSLAFELIVPMMAKNTPVPNYIFPDQIVAGANNILTLNPITGDIVWNAPKKAGEYNIAIRVNEYRQGVLISSTVRDMQILIINCNNRPPKIETITDTCIVVGQTLTFNVMATDPDSPAQKVRLSALGGPMVIEGNKAEFQAPRGFAPSPVSGTFIWAPDCNAISSSPYSIIFKAEDNQKDSTGLVDLKTVRIKVVGPGPENLTGEPNLNTIVLKWTDPYYCDNARHDYFQGFNIWRRVSSSGFEPDSCNPSMEGKGYTKIAFKQKSSDGIFYHYVDGQVEKGKAYCYRIEAEFAKISPGGFPYNVVRSLPSNEVCLQLNLDVPLITKASVLSTGLDDSVRIEWIKPSVSDFDTLKYPGPYRYVLKHGTGLSPTTYTEVPGASFTSQHFLDPIVTYFTHHSLKTESEPYTYIVDFYSDGSGEKYGTSTSASTVFLNVVGSDKKAIITWAESVPWSNHTYTIYRKNNLNVFDSIGTTQSRRYEDRNLENGKNYCYKIRTSGSYGIAGLPNPILNFSQEQCATPVDTVPPCSPTLKITNDCMAENPSPSIVNKLTWNNPDEVCDTPGDTKGYRIYVIHDKVDEPELIFETNDPKLISLDYASEEYGLAGCYYIVAFDSVFNESPKSNIVCIENCPSYRLPNAFSPNNDGHNDVFKPYPYRFVNKVEFKVFNRWGNVIFETTNPNINWDGNNRAGNKVPDGTYYYTCKVFETIETMTGIENTIILTGYIELIR